MRVRIFHNNHHGEAVCDGYRAEHTVTEVYAYGSTTMRPELVCQQAWYLCHEAHHHGELVTPDPVAIGYRARQNRPLDTGDVIAVGDRFYAVAHIGWMPIREPLLDNRTLPGTTPIHSPIPEMSSTTTGVRLTADERHLRHVLEQERRIPWTRLPDRGIAAANGLIAHGLAAIDTSGTWTLALPDPAVTR